MTSQKDTSPLLPTLVPELHELPAEFQHMLKQDMTLGQAIVEHRKNWRFQSEQRFRHEATHLMLGLAGITPYQGTMDAENYVMALQDIIMNPDDYQQYDRKEAATEVIKISISQVGNVNFDRTLCWLEGRNFNKSYDDIRRDANYINRYPNTIDDTVKVNCGIIECKILNEHERLAKGWKIVAKHNGRNEIYQWDPRHPEQNKLPVGTNSVEDFIPYHIPLPKEVDAKLEKFEPIVTFLKIVCNKIKTENPSCSHTKLRELIEEKLSAIPIRELYAAMAPQPKPHIEGGTVTRRGVEPDAASASR